MAAIWGRWVTQSTCFCRATWAIFSGYLLGRPTGHAGVHLVKDQTWSIVVVLRQHIFQRQHDAGQLSAGGDLLDGLQSLTHVGGHEELHFVRARFHPCHKVQVLRR